MRLMDARPLDRMKTQFHRSMRSLLRNICRDFERNYAEAVQVFRLPIQWYRQLAGSLTLQEFGDARAVGWIESLNDLLYFADAGS